MKMSNAKGPAYRRQANDKPNSNLECQNILNFEILTSFDIKPCLGFDIRISPVKSKIRVFLR